MPRLCFGVQLNLVLCYHISTLHFHLADMLVCDFEEWQKHVSQEFVSVQYIIISLDIIDNEKEIEKYLQLHIHIHKYLMECQRSDDICYDILKLKEVSKTCWIMNTTVSFCVWRDKVLLLIKFPHKYPIGINFCGINFCGTILCDW